MKSPILAASLLPSTVEHNDSTIYAAMKELKYPVLATTKLDGIRALVMNRGLFSRKLKWIPNIEVQKKFKDLPVGFDGELYHHDIPFNEIQSIVMSDCVNHRDIEFHVLDYYTLLFEPYEKRIEEVDYWFDQFKQFSLPLKFELPTYCKNADDLFAFEKKVIEEKGEGICFRLLDSPYKQGRSTLKEQYLVKLTRFVYTDVTIIDYIEQQESIAPEKRDEHGNMDKSHSKIYLKNSGTLGAFKVRMENGVEFNIGSGLTDEEKQDIWNQKEQLIGKTLTIKHKPCGAKIKPRHPVIWGFRKD